MINFFRKIRYDLMEKNKTGKYFKYAIGEILLVVLGILIALKVNDWNENNKQLRQENVYLIKLQEDIQNIKSILTLQIKNVPIRIKEAQDALMYVQQCNAVATGKEALENTLLSHGNLGTVYIRETTYAEMLSNGAFTRIHNDSIKQTISDVYSKLHNANAYISYFRDELGRASTIIWNHVEKEFKPNIELDILSQDQLMVKYNYQELCSSGVFKNALVEVIDSRQDFYGISMFTMQDLDNALILLKTEIEK